MFNLKKYPKKKALNVNDSIVVSRPDGSIINFNSPISVDNTGNATFSGNVTIQGNLSILNSASQNISFGDSDSLYFGNSNDIEIVHVNDQSFIINNTGDLIFDQRTDDRDIIFKCDDGSGGTTTYITLDGSHTKTVFSKFTLYEDNVKAEFGNSADLQIFHDGTHGQIVNNSSNLFIKNNTNDGDIVFQSDNGSGGITGYFFLDGSQTRTQFDKDIMLIGGSSYIFVDNSAGIMNFADGVSATFGNGSDLELLHDGNDSFITARNTDLKIQQLADDKDIKFFCDDGSGGTTEYLRIDGGSEKTFYSKPILLFDSVALQLGTDTDATLFHSGGEGTLQNFTGNFRFIQGQDNGDIQFFCDDGSGGVTEYFRLDGGSERTVFTKGLQFFDNVKSFYGDGQDFKIFHNGTDSIIQNDTGDLEIVNKADDKDIKFQCDDGSGGVETYFFLDGSSNNTKFQKDLRIVDNIALTIGNENDLILRHNTTNSEIINNTGDLNIRNQFDDGDITFSSDDGSGGTTEYFRLDGGAGYTIVQKQIRFDDNVPAKFGTNNDLHIFHDGTDSLVDNYTGDLYFRQTADDKDIIFQSDDGSGGLADYIRLDGSDSAIKVGKELQVNGDNRKLKFGAGNDLEIYHDGSNSFINETGTGSLIQQASAHFIRQGGTNNTNNAIMILSGSVSLFHNNVSKLETTSTGIDVSGAIEMDKSLTMSHISDPSDPATGKSVMWSNTDGDLKIKINVGGTVVTRTLATFSD